MKFPSCFACLLCLILVSPTLTNAQGGMISLFGDSTGTDCSIVDSEPNTLIEIYVLHVFAPPVNASEFRVPTPDCAANLVFLGDHIPFPNGAMTYTSPEGCAVAYASCHVGTFHILTIRYWGQGLTENCCVFNVEDYPGETPPGIYMSTCDGDPPQIPGAAGTPAIVNPDDTCPCSTVPVEQTTWGKVKAFYVQ